MGERVFSISRPAPLLLRKLLNEELGDELRKDEGVADMFLEDLGDR